MNYYVYLLITSDHNKIISYVGYTKDLKKRLSMHNSSKGAKFTRGRNWTLIYKKGYKSKSLAMKEEHNLKKNTKLRKNIKDKYIKKCII